MKMPPCCCVVTLPDLCDLPASIGSLGKTLRKLNLSENNLSYLPEGLGGLTVLHTLRASNNLLLELPDALMAVTSLTQLDLSYNR
jgi:Leucine-rich repeat (LRR) protein